MKKIIDMCLRFFDNTNVTTDPGMSVEMKTYYDKKVLENAKPKLVHDQFGQKRNIPKNGGKTIEFRKPNQFDVAGELQEGVTPSGKKLSWTNLTATVKQYGDYAELSDVLILTALDNNLVMASEEMGTQAGLTLDRVTREVLNGGTNVMYYDGTVSGRHLLVGGTNAKDNGVADSNCHYFKINCAGEGARQLALYKADKINGSYPAIAHVNTIYDLMLHDPNWKDAVKYSNAEKIFNGEVGNVLGVRFVETTEAKIFHAENLTKEARNLTVASKSSKTITVSEAISAEDATALAGRKILIDGALYTVVSAVSGNAGSSTITVAETLASGVTASAKIFPGEAGAYGDDVYSTIILGKDAYGTTEIEGGGLEFIVKQLGSAGSSDPLNQRATTGWKAMKTAVRLAEQNMIRIEHTCSRTGVAN